MKLIQFAVASIVDASTGYGLTSFGGGIDYAAANQHGRKIRGKTIAALISQIKTQVNSAISSCRVRALRRRGLAELSRLDDRLLKDIGLFRGDLIAVQLGHADLCELTAQGGAGHANADLNLAVPDALNAPGLEFKAINEADYGAQKCA